MYKNDHGNHSEDDTFIQIGDIRLWKHLLGFIAVQRKWVGLAIVLAFIITAAGLALPRIVQLAMDRFILNEGLPLEERISGLTTLSAIFLGIILIGFIANFFQVIVLEWTGQTIMHSMRQRLFTHMMNLNLTFFNAHPVGRLVTRMTNDIQNMHEMFTSVVVTLFNEAVRIVGILAILFWLNWRLAFLLAILFPVIAIITYFFGKLSRSAFRRLRTQLAAVNAFIQESVSGVSVIQLFLRERDTFRRFRSLNQEYFKSALFQIKIFGIFVPLIEVIHSLAIALVIWYGGREILREHMTLGILTAYISYVRLFFQPLRELSQKYTIVQSALASAERIFHLLEIRDFMPVPEDPLRPGRIEGAIAFEGVDFEYESGRPVIKDLSFRIEPGETLAIIGATGSGKSTIINLLERLYDPIEGSIRLDGNDLQRYDIQCLRDQIGLVMQDVFLVPGTIRENILLDRELPESELKRIVDLSQLSSLLAGLPEGIDTRVGEGGMGLSAGQRQLLAFARVLARNPRILVLDEATANVDTETEMLIEEAIQAALLGRTSIVIAHRLSTIRRADRILVMEHGRIVEQGTHASLMARNGVYHHLQMLQNGFESHQKGF